MNIDESLNNCFTPEEVSRIRKRIVESPTSGQDAEREFYLFFEALRKAAEAYTMLMFNRGIKLVDFDLERGRIAVRDESGKVVEIDLSR